MVPKCGCGQKWDNHDPEKCDPLPLPCIRCGNVQCECSSKTLEDVLFESNGHSGGAISVRLWLKNIVQICLTENDSSTHIVAKDLIGRIEK